MDRILLHDKFFVPFISNEEIVAAIDRVAAQMNKDFKGYDRPPMLLCVLNGSIVFTGELMQRLNFPLEVTSLRVSSYRGTRSGEIEQIVGLTNDVQGRTVIIVEDIVDTGKTMKFLHDHLLQRGAHDVRICTLLCKPDVFDNSVELDYVAMNIENRFIVGFGLDYDQLGRNYKDIYVLDENQNPQ